MRRLARPAFVVAVAAMVLRVDPVLGVAVGLAMWAALSWWLPARAVDGVEVSKSHPDRVFHGETVEVHYDVRAARRIPWLSVVDAIPFELGPSVRWVTSVDRGEVRSCDVTVVAARRGLHRLGPTVLTSGDTFSSRSVRARGLRSTTLLVYPKLVGIEQLGLSASSLDPLRATRRPLLPDPSRVVGVRDYAPGDSLRSIHWTTSARVGSLQTKKTQPATARTVSVMLDLSHGHHPVPGRRRSAELAVTAAASIAHHLVTVADEAVAVRAWCTDAPTGTEGLNEARSGHGIGHLAQILELLARAEPVRRELGEILLDPSGLVFGSAVVLVTGVTARSHVAPLGRLRRLGYEVSVVSTAGDRHHSEWDAELTSIGIPVAHASYYQEISAL